ncbi:serine protease [Pseudogemmobacter humi]|uniref:Peptidoglycan binding domain protein n=1 Tax=Pseudogemmobacter humi TaxID=2483812 RepID=A0A3P5XE86_9RHOB|nr:serine protease [Pseudogemmobacter humi]VDC33040.1 Putative peptidoglycan binding domain protein [Pseudogemmobacter humi]
MMPAVRSACRLAAFAVFLMFPGLTAALAQEAWIQVEARSDQRLAEERAFAFATSFTETRGFRLPSGWYAIVLGPYDADEAAQILASLKSRRLIPSDSYITDGREFREPFWPKEGGAAPVAAAEPAAADVAEPADEPVSDPAVIDETPAEARATEAALTTDEKKELQSALSWFGFYQGGIDGAFGPGTRTAMAAWQTAFGLEPSGVLTTRQRATLVASHQAEIAEYGFALVEEQESGIDVTLPLALVEFDRYEPPFVHFREKNGSGLSVVLISQPGDAGSLAGLYEILTTLDAMPQTGERKAGESEFRIRGRSADRDSQAWARLSDGLIKGWMVFSSPEHAERDARIAEVIETSFRAVGDTALDPGLVPLDEAARRGLVAGLEVKKPLTGRSGFYVGADGAVLTTSDAVAECGRITIDHTTEASVAAQSEGFALLKPASPLAPPAVAAFAESAARPGSAIALAGYPYEGRLPAPVLTHGTFEEAGGLNGEPGLLRLSLDTRPGDAGGPVLDAAGGVIGMLLPAVEGGAQQLPAGVTFAADTARIAAFLGAGGVSPRTTGAAPALPPETLTRQATGMTVLVSCWE